MFNLINLLTMEDIEDELEYTYHMQLTDLKSLDKYESYEIQQAEYFIESNGIKQGLIRTRKVSNDPELKMTIKLFNDQGGNRGYVSTINEDLFNGFDLIASRLIKKRRYVINIPDTDMCWEIDLPQPNYENWVKVDLEVSSRDSEVPDFPLEVNQVIDVSFKRKVTSAESEILDSIFKNTTTVRNV